MNPSPDEERAAAAEAALRDLAAFVAVHEMVILGQIDSDDVTPMAVMSWIQEHERRGVLVMFHDGEIRIEPELRDPEDVLAQVAIPKTGHGRLASVARVAALRGKVSDA